MVDDRGMTSASATGLPTTTPENRRRSLRKPYCIEAWLSSPTAGEGDERLEARAVNLSRHGIRFDTSQPLPVGCFYMIEVGMGEQRIHSEIRIVSSRQVDTNRHSIGAAFC
jgi:hypothetical protein